MTLMLTAVLALILCVGGVVLTRAASPDLLCISFIRRPEDAEVRP